MGSSKVESNQYIWSVPALRDAGDEAVPLCSSKAFSASYRKDAEFCAKEMQRVFGGYFRAIPEYKHSRFDTSADHCVEFTVKRISESEGRISEGETTIYGLLSDLVASITEYLNPPQECYYDNRGGIYYKPGPFAGGMHFVGL